MINIVILLIFLLSTPVNAMQSTVYQALTGEQAVLEVHAATDINIMAPLIKDFQEIYPHVSLVYHEYTTVELLNFATEGCRVRNSKIDVIISSSVDHLIKMANDGCALKHVSPSANSHPGWAQWRSEVFGFTFEPAVIVYNRDRVPSTDWKTTRWELLDLLRKQQSVYQGRVGTYDIEQSGIGYLFASYDSRFGGTYGRLLEAFGRSNVRLSCCTTELLADLASGSLSIGYNLIGSYAVAAARKGGSLVIVIPQDYVVALSRSVLATSFGANRQESTAFIDYLLSRRGQKVAQASSFFFGFDGSLPPEVISSSVLETSGVVRRIEVGPELLAIQDFARRRSFLAEWQKSLGLVE